MWGKNLYVLYCKNVSADLLIQYYYYIVKVSNKIDEMHHFCFLNYNFPTN